MPITLFQFLPRLLFSSLKWLLLADVSSKQDHGFGGYLLHSVEGERRYKIVNLEHVQVIMTENKRNELKGEDLFDIDEYLSEESDLFDSTSKSLFEYILPEPKRFYEQSEPSATKAVSSRTSAACKKISKTELVITIMYKNNKKKYVRYSDALGELTFTNPKDLFIDALETNNSPCHLLFDIEGLVFTKADSNIIKECYLNKGLYQSFSENLMMRCYEVAQAKGNRSVMKTSFSGKKEAVLKKFHRKTIKYYGHCIVPNVSCY